MCERFEPRSHFKSRLCLIVRVNVVLNRAVVVDSDWRFDNLCGTHLQSQSELYHVSWGYYTLVVDLIGQLRRDVIGRLSVNPWCYWLWRLLISNRCVSIRLLSQLSVYCSQQFLLYVISWSKSFFFVFALKICCRQQSVVPFLSGAPTTKRSPGSAHVDSMQIYYVCLLNVMVVVSVNGRQEKYGDGTLFMK